MRAMDQRKVSRYKVVRLMTGTCGCSGGLADKNLAADMGKNDWC